MSAPKLSPAQLEYLAAVADKQELLRNLEAIKKQIGHQHCKVTRLSAALSSKELAEAQSFRLTQERDNG